MDATLRIKVGKKKIIIIAVSILSLVLIVLMGVYMTFAHYYKNHFFKGTMINGIDVSKMSIETLNEKIQDYTLTIIERNSEGEIVKEEIKGSEIGLKISLDSGLESILKKQSESSWLFGSGQKEQINKVTEYDEKLLQKKMEELQCFSKDFVTEPQNAYVEPYNEQTKEFNLVKEIYGNKLDKDKTKKVLTQAIQELKEEVYLEKEECYIQPEYKAKDVEIVNFHKKLNQYVNTNITYMFGESAEELKGTQIVEWLVIDTNQLTVSLDMDKVRTYVNYIAKTYDTAFKDRIFMTSYGQEVLIDRGDYGWWINREEETIALAAAIEAGESGVRTPVYKRTAAQYSEKDYGNTYVEINLTAQHLFFYKDGQKILESDFVSGQAGTHDTPAGIYGVTYTQKDAVLRGADYQTPVAYWMPFNGNIGLHDATWRDVFGSNYYQTNGSHGCINLPYQTAKQLYEYLSAGMPIICYHLPGTEAVVEVLQEDTLTQDLPQEPQTPQIPQTPQEQETSQEPETPKAEAPQEPETPKAETPQEPETPKAETPQEPETPQESETSQEPETPQELETPQEIESENNL